jgi:hypothetical protein
MGKLAARDNSAWTRSCLRNLNSSTTPQILLESALVHSVHYRCGSEIG